MAMGKAVLILLMDGTLTGITRCSIANWTGLVYKIPRTEVNKCKDFEDLRQCCVYFLFGESEDDGSPVVYIGQAGLRKSGDSVLVRLQEHINNPQKNYWTEAVVFTSNSFGPTELNYLEHKFCALAQETNQYIVKNGNDPNPGKVTLEKEFELKEVIEYSKIITGLLGYKIFEEKKYSGVDLYMGNNQRAICKRTSEGFIVLKGSYIKQGNSTTLSSSYRLLRAKYEHLIDSNDKLQKDTFFASPSAAASFVLGRNANGLTEWKTFDGKTLKDVESEE
jgi:hypothetical protein